MTLMSLFLLVGFSACGKEAAAGAHPEFTQQRDMSAHDFDSATIGWEFDNHEGLKIHKTQSDLYLQFTHDSALPNVQFFLDVDNDEDTGVPIERGADYMVENGWLYVSTKENTWGWKELIKVPCAIQEGVSDTVKISLSSLQNRSTIFRVHTQSLTYDWTPKVFSPHEIGTKFTFNTK